MIVEFNRVRGSHLAALFAKIASCVQKSVLEKYEW